jgi:hypothetical protein
MQLVSKQQLDKDYPPETRRTQQYSYNGNWGFSLWSVPKNCLEDIAMYEANGPCDP